MKDNGLWSQMTREAFEELATGKKSWRECDTNTLLMACFHAHSNHMYHKLLKPLWFFSAAIGTAVVGFLLNTFLFS